jgi:magnesium-transporting ATPase (P-type)
MVVDGRTLSRILDTDAELLLAELAYQCSGVVVCRASPAQKAAIVRMMKRFHAQQVVHAQQQALCACTCFSRFWGVHGRF